MKAINVTEKEIQTAFNAVKSEEAKQILTALFGQQKEKVKPTLDDYTTIKTYEDACEALEITPILSDDRNKVLHAEFSDYHDFLQSMPKHIIALMKLEIISRALWGRNWEPTPNTNASKKLYYPYFSLWSKYELDCFSEKHRSAILPITTNCGTKAWFGCLYTNNQLSNVNANIGFRLSQETEEKAIYFGRQFIKLWVEYLKYNFEVELLPTEL